MVDQMITLRMRLNERVHKSNARSKYLEKTLATRTKSYARRDALARAALETETLGVEANDLRRRNLPPTNALVGRLDRMSRALRRDADIADARARRSGDVRGGARVRLMGDFDDWTRGFRLTPDRGDDDDRDDVFSCVCALPPGTYQVKFLIDDEEGGRRRIGKPSATATNATWCFASSEEETDGDDVRADGDTDDVRVSHRVNKTRIRIHSFIQKYVRLSNSCRFAARGVTMHHITRRHTSSTTRGAGTTESTGRRPSTVTMSSTSSARRSSRHRVNGACARWCAIALVVAVASATS